MRNVLALMAVAVILSGCAGFRKDATPEEKAATAGTVETVTTAIGKALPWPWNQIAFGVGAVALGIVAGKRGYGFRLPVTTPPTVPK